MTLEELFRKHLEERQSAGLLRKPEPGVRGIDFASNDYLGFARETPSSDLHGPSGAGASRLLGGYHDSLRMLEANLAHRYRAEQVSFFASGFEANHGLFEMLSETGVHILYDAEIHASIRTALRSGKSKAWSFRHNDLADLAARLERIPRPCAVVTEGYFSMSGDAAPLRQIANLKAQQDFTLIVDEAHSTGTAGMGFCGLTGTLGLLDQVDVRIHTFGKALGSQGACIAGNAQLAAMLANFCRPYIYSTAPSPLLTQAVLQAHERFETGQKDRFLALQANIQHYLEVTKQLRHFSRQGGPIQFFSTRNAEELHQLVQDLRSGGFKVFGIRPPTLPPGDFQLRILIHSVHTKEEISALVDAICSIRVF